MPEKCEPVHGSTFARSHLWGQLVLEHEEGVEIAGTTEFFQHYGTHGTSVCPSLIIEPVIDELRLFKTGFISVLQIIQSQRNEDSLVYRTEKLEFLTLYSRGAVKREERLSDWCTVVVILSRYLLSLSQSLRYKGLFGRSSDLYIFILWKIPRSKTPFHQSVRNSMNLLICGINHVVRRFSFPILHDIRNH